MQDNIGLLFVMCKNSGVIICLTSHDIPQQTTLILKIGTQSLAKDILECTPGLHLLAQVHSVRKSIHVVYLPQQ